MTTKHPTSEKWYQKYAWMIFLLTGVFQLISGLGSTLTAGETEWASRFETVVGAEWEGFAASNPPIFKFISLVNTEGGVLRVGLAAFVIIISLTGYRKGEKWAWYLFLLLPVIFTGSLIVNELHGVSLVGFAAPFFLLYLLGFVLPFRKFFPKSPAPMQE